MVSSAFPIEALRARHTGIYVIVSPPRCGSTAFARVFWEHPSVRYYCHEPFEVTYYHGQGLPEVAAKLADPLDLTAHGSPVDAASGDSLVIKEMPYQVGDHFPLLARLATKPLLFLIREPRLNIASRIARKRETGEPPVFPLIETGWTLIARHLAYCRRHDIPYLIVEASDFRNTPREIFPQVFAHFGLTFTPEMASWQPYPGVDLDNLGGVHTHLYRRVLTSSGLQPATESIPPLDAFPKEGGFREHVAACLDLYARLCRDAHRVRPQKGAS